MDSDLVAELDKRNGAESVLIIGKPLEKRTKLPIGWSVPARKLSKSSSRFLPHDADREFALLPRAEPRCLMVSVRYRRKNSAVE